MILPKLPSAPEYLPTTFWLMKSEPGVFSFDHLLAKQEEFWDGVRNYQARNFMRDHMDVGHKVLFYHSNSNPSGIAGLAEVVAKARPETTESGKPDPTWCGVTVGNPHLLPRFLSLDELKTIPQLQGMLLLRRGQRLSILPVSPEEYKFVVQVANNPPHTTSPLLRN